jgi:hypothetical protein
MKKYWIAAVLVVALAAGAMFSINRNPPPTPTPTPAAKADKLGDPASSSNLPRLKRSALKPIHLPSSVSPKPILGSGADGYSGNLSRLPASCQDPLLIKEIIENELVALVDLASLSEARSQDCLKAFVSHSECFDNSKPGDDYHLCSNNIAIARAKIIDTLTSNARPEPLDEGIIANKIIAKIYSSEKNMDQQAAELFQLSDQLVATNSENLEAHNLRSYLSFQLLKNHDDADVLQKALQSSDFLRRSSDSNLVTLGYLQQFALEILSYARANIAESIEKADSIAEQFLVEFPDNPKGMIMKSVVFGYKGDLANCKEWTEKALAKGGPSQSGFEEYKQIVQSIASGTFDRKMLGVRISSSEAFIPERIIQ